MGATDGRAALVTKALLLIGGDRGVFAAFGFSDSSGIFSRLLIAHAPLAAHISSIEGPRKTAL
ncbi:hypothetical protein [Sulfitobacter sp. SH22]|jgi:hypothetical protein